MKILRNETQKIFFIKTFFSVFLSGLLLTFGQLAVASTTAAAPAAEKTSIIAPKITKSFNPGSITANEFVTMVIGFTNPNAEEAKFTAPFTEKLPSGVVIIGSASSSCGGTLTAEAGSSKIILADAKIPAFAVCEILVGVTATHAGNYEAKTPAAVLQTDKGSNLVASSATLKASRAIQKDLRVKKFFNPAAIKLNEFTTMNISLSNPNNETVKLAAPFSDYLPDGMVILGSVSTTCEGKLSANPGSTKVVLADAKIPANGSCDIYLGATAPESVKAESKNSNAADTPANELIPKSDQPTANITTE